MSCRNPSRTESSRRLLGQVLLLWVLLVGTWAADAAAAVTLPVGATLQSDIVYGADPAQRFDVYQPAPADGLAPIIFMVHGGAWRLGDKAEANVVDNKVPHWVGKGFVFVSINYRMLPTADPLQQAQDVAQALAYVQQHAADFNGDPSRIILMGHSAGAHLISLVSTHPTLAPSKGITPWLGTVSLDSAALDVVYIMEHPHLPLYDAAFGTDPVFWAATSPYHVMVQPVPPLLAVCSTFRAESMLQSARFDERGAQIGTAVTVLAKDLTHEEINATLGIPGAYTDEVESFLGTLDPVVAAMLGLAPPVITTQPVSISTTTGSGSVFTMTCAGAAPLTYQWHKNGLPISGAISSSYPIALTTMADAGSYTVVATNSVGSVTSNAAELTVRPAAFDVAGYYLRNPAEAALYGADHYGAWLHFRNQGIYDGETFDDQFLVEEYLALYPELAAIYGADLGAVAEHWLTTGKFEGRLGRVPTGFNAAGYFSRNPDVAAAVNNDPILAWEHFWLYGIYEGRAYDDELRVFEYLAINADLTAAFVNDWRQATLHWLRYGQTEGRLGRLPLTFNVSEYLVRSPDVAATWGTNPTTVFLHYWAYGIDEGRTYDDLFRADEYLALNPDLLAAFGTDRRGAFKHWVRYGQSEGRAGRFP